MKPSTLGGLLRPAILAAAFVAAGALPASAQLQIESKDGSSTLKIGILVQPQFESLETADGQDTSANMFLRRFRVLFGGKVANKWLYFFETDSPNLGKSNPEKAANPTGAKDAGDVYIQDIFLTYDHSAAFKVDIGMLLFPFSHNHGQSAATLLPVDYGAYTFVESAPMGERVGRDYGIALRGYPFKQKFEYRFAMLQGVRGVQATNALRFAGRGVYYPFGADTGFFYGGTWQGTKKLLGIGGSFDVQKDYKAGGADLIYEQPINKGDQGITFQVGWNHLNGGDFVTALPKQDTFLVEGGYHLGKGRVTPFFQYSAHSFDNATLADQSAYQVGMAWWLKGHNRNVKASIGQQRTDGRPNRLQGLVQLQIFAY